MLWVVLRSLTSDEIEVFDHVPRELSQAVRVVEVPFLAPATDALTLGRTVLVRRGHTRSQQLLAHELVHVQQWDRLGAATFLAQYLGAYATNLFRLRRHRPAYLAIPLEVEARDRARRWAETHRGR